MDYTELLKMACFYLALIFGLKFVIKYIARTIKNLR